MPAEPKKQSSLTRVARSTCGRAQKQIPAISYTRAVAQKPKLQFNVRASFATALRDWRLRNNVGLKEVASDLGVSIATVNTWESGKRFPSGRHFELLVNYLGMPPCRLFCVMADKCVPMECLRPLPSQ